MAPLFPLLLVPYLLLPVVSTANKKLQYHTIHRRPQQQQEDRSLSSLREDDLDELRLGRGLHYVTLHVGCPPQIQTVIVDTGSPVTGFPCSGCTVRCGEGFHLNPPYQEQDSACFAAVDCNACFLRSPPYCASSGVCPVGVSYAEGSSWYGHEVQDIVSSGDSLDAERFMLNFACQIELTGLFPTQLIDGIMGMGKSTRGVYWRQLYDAGGIERQQFSLCYGDLFVNLTTASGVMVLGGTDERLHETRMVFAQDYLEYGIFFAPRIKNMYLRTKGGFSVVATSPNSNLTRLEIPRHSNPTLDSGTTCTYLSSLYYDAFVEAWFRVVKEQYEPFGLVNLSKNDTLDELPTILIQLQGSEGNDVTAAGSANDPDRPNDILVAFPPSRYLRKVGETYYYNLYRFCLYMTKEDDDGILGRNFISGHDVLFDVENLQIGFAESTCELEEDTVPPPTVVPKEEITTPSASTEETTNPSASTEETTNPSAATNTAAAAASCLIGVFAIFYLA